MNCTRSANLSLSISSFVLFEIHLVFWQKFTLVIPDQWNLPGLVQNGNSFTANPLECQIAVSLLKQIPPCCEWKDLVRSLQASMKDMNMGCHFVKNAVSHF